MGFALSTSWNASDYEDGKKMLFEIKGAGFDEVELSFNLTSSMIQDIKQLVKSREVKVLSLHNYCPVPDGIERFKAMPDCYSLASPDENERKLAVKFTKRTIDTAKDLDAKAVVLHCGRVEIEDRTNELIELYRKGRKDTQEFKQIKEGVKEKRKSAQKKFFEKTLFSLEELNKYSQAKNVILGIETRFYYPEIPSQEEISVILNKFRGSNIYYWHDTGHAQVLDDLGFAVHKEFLDMFGEYMVGVHLHDILACLDHMAPSKGEFDFTLLRPYLKKATLKILEVHHPATVKDLQQAREYLTRVLYG